MYSWVYCWPGDDDVSLWYKREQKNERSKKKKIEGEDEENDFIR
jgi:hypothetical protein